MQASESPAPSPGGSATPPRIPRLGAAASGLVALLLVGGLFAVPFLGLVIAPLGLIPVLHFQAGGGQGIRAWGPVVALLTAAALVGVAGFALPLLAAYSLIIVVPALAAEAWVHWRWSEGRWAAVATLAATLAVLVAVLLIARPHPPVDAISEWVRAATADMQKLYDSWGMDAGEMELALDAAEGMAAWVLPSLPVAYLVVVLFWVRPRLPLLGVDCEVAPFEEYRNDEWLPAVFAAAGIGTLVLGGTARWFALNILVAVLILYFVQGLAIIRAHLARFIGRGWLVRWGVALICLQVPFPVMVAALGVADSFHSLRPRAKDDGGTQ
jgi:hypothetical protein